jgi:hypothetical protein
VEWGGEIFPISHLLHKCGNLLPMSDKNIVTSTSLKVDKETETIEKVETVKKAPAKKIAAKKEIKGIKEGYKLIIFESGSLMNSSGYIFTREDPIQEVEEEVADRFLDLDNFRLPTQSELEEYLSSKEA